MIYLHYKNECLKNKRHKIEKKNYKQFDFTPNFLLPPPPFLIHFKNLNDRYKNSQKSDTNQKLICHLLLKITQLSGIHTQVLDVTHFSLVLNPESPECDISY